MRFTKAAFTLIELLIVVAIIAILAAIAVPNFLEAQTRSKVARTKSDMRTLATGIESYCVDNNVFPVSDWSSYKYGTGTVGARLYCCTTPIAYITNIPRDPFVLTTFAIWWDTYEYWDDRCSREYRPNDPWGIEGRASFGYAWRLLSLGPNYTGDSWRYVPGTDDLTYVYDPTNGTVSIGDIIRIGGPAVYNRHTRYTNL
ncbi:MAG: prepilin-type N-terminal cleavage/methylation domain-containing protein [bacterium]